MGDCLRIKAGILQRMITATFLINKDGFNLTKAVKSGIAAKSSTTENFEVL